MRREHFPSHRRKRKKRHAWVADVENSHITFYDRKKILPFATLHVTPPPPISYDWCGYLVAQHYHLWRQHCELLHSVAYILSFEWRVASPIMCHVCHHVYDNDSTPTTNWTQTKLYFKLIFCPSRGWLFWWRCLYFRNDVVTKFCWIFDHFKHILQRQQSELG